VLSDLATPVALVDLDVFSRNVAFGATRATELSVALRPHAKTVKSPALLADVMGAGAVGLTVSTLGEIRTLTPIVTDLLYGVPVAPGKASHIVESLGSTDVRLTVIVDSVEAVSAIPSDPRVDVAIEIDCDGHRGGVSPESPTLVEIAERVAAGHRLRGIMTHGGGSYLGTPQEVGRVAGAERDAVVVAASHLRRAGHRIEMVSVGSTPTFVAVDDLEGVTEARPGVYLFGDMSMVELGIFPPDRMALSVLATVIGLVAGGSTALIDAGWSALSQDRGGSLAGRTHRDRRGHGAKSR
jgi:D-serine deaminase-like pyridoxal phosphate-dependent protein